MICNFLQYLAFDLNLIDVPVLGFLIEELLGFFGCTVG